MITAVLDANVLASGALASGSPPALVIDFWRAGRFRIVVSDWILDELQRTLRKPYFIRRVGATAVDGYLALLAGTAVVVPITTIVQGVATHPEDDQVLSTAVSAQAEYLVTGDGGLLVLESYAAITILRPRAFLVILAQTTGA